MRAAVALEQAPPSADISDGTMKGVTLSDRTTEAVQAARLYQQQLRPRAKVKLHLRPGASEVPWAAALRARFGPSVLSGRRRAGRVVNRHAAHSAGNYH